MPFAGLVVARGELHPVLVVLAGAFGSVLGALPWFFAAHHWGAERLNRLSDRHGCWIIVSREELDRAERWFHRRRALVLVFGRLVPGVRTLIAVRHAANAFPRLVGTWLAAVECAAHWGRYIMESRYAQIGAVLELAARGMSAAILLAYVWRSCRQVGVDWAAIHRASMAPPCSAQEGASRRAW